MNWKLNSQQLSKIFVSKKRATFLTFRTHFKKALRKVIGQLVIYLSQVLYANQFSNDLQLNDYYLLSSIFSVFLFEFVINLE